jgi:asparagine synthase (glutamine-hydrolysing)
MCGICGFFPVGSPDSTRKKIERMMARLVHRGPDDTDYYLDECFALGHRRLSIIDLQGGKQPMTYAGCTIIYNGEVYNFKEIREELANEGYKFKTHSDTEVILKAYHCWGEICLDRFNGMFAFAIWDRKNRQLFCARDRFGKKPFYYFFDGNSFIFASEPKALLEHPSIDKSIDRNSLVTFLCREYLPGKRSIFKDVRKLPGGHYLKFRADEKRLTTTKWWNCEYFKGYEKPPSEKEAASEIRRLLSESVRKRLVSDVPLGLFLSGGIDSTAILFAMSQFRPASEIKTFSIGFDHPDFDESESALMASKAVGSDHYTKTINSKDALAALPRLASVLDEPFSDPSIIPTFLLCEFAREQVTVALAGDGGDELFAGYNSFLADKPSRIADKFLTPDMSRLIGKLGRRALKLTDKPFGFDFIFERFFRGMAHPSHIRHAAWLGSFEAGDLKNILSSETTRRFDPAVVYADAVNLHNKVKDLDSISKAIYFFTRSYMQEDILYKVDRASMAVSLEVRAPFLDFELASYINMLPSNYKIRLNRQKYILKKALKQTVPNQILSRPKQGFTIPLAAWLRSGFKEMLLDLYQPSAIRDVGIFDADNVGRLISEHMSGKRNHHRQLFTLLMFELWRREYLE